MTDNKKISYAIIDQEKNPFSYSVQGLYSRIKMGKKGALETVTVGKGTKRRKGPVPKIRSDT